MKFTKDNIKVGDKVFIHSLRYCKENDPFNIGAILSSHHSRWRAVKEKIEDGIPKFTSEESGNYKYCYGWIETIGKVRIDKKGNLL